MIALQDEITRNISKSLEMKFYARTDSRSGTNLEALELSINAWSLIELVTPADLIEARSLWERSIEIGGEQPDFLTGIAWTHLLDARSQFTGDPLASLKMSEEANQRALQLDDSFHRVHTLLGYFAVAYGKYDEAVAHAKKATSLAPNDAWANWNLAYMYTHAGRHLSVSDCLIIFTIRNGEIAQQRVRVGPRFVQFQCALICLLGFLERSHGIIREMIPCVEQVGPRDAGQEVGLLTADLDGPFPERSCLNHGSRGDSLNQRPSLCAELPRIEIGARSRLGAGVKCNSERP